MFQATHIYAPDRTDLAFTVDLNWLLGRQCGWSTLSRHDICIDVFFPVFVSTFRFLQGYFGECGLRGGYMEVHGIGAEVSLIWVHR